MHRIRCIAIFIVIIGFSRTVYFGGSSADGFVQRHIVDVVARAVRIVCIVVVRLVHSRRLAVEERRQFLEQTKGFSFTQESIKSRETARMKPRVRNSRIYPLTRVTTRVFGDDIVQSASSFKGARENHLP